MDYSQKQSEIEAQIAELSQRYREAEAIMQRAHESVIFLQGQLVLLQELQKPTDTPENT